MGTSTIIIAILTGLLAGSEYLSQSQKFESNGWIDLIKTGLEFVKSKLSTMQAK